MTDTNINIRIAIFGGSGYGGGTDRLLFGSATGLNASQLGSILWKNPFGGGDVMGSYIYASGEVVPVPEPATVVAVIALVALVCYRERRQVTRLVLVLTRKVRQNY